MILYAARYAPKGPKKAFKYRSPRILAFPERLSCLNALLTLNRNQFINHILCQKKVTYWAKDICPLAT